jgi:acyl-CoA thioester hydrolase
MIEGFVVVERIPVLWGDMDAFGHVNNTRFIRWFESARIAHFARVGITTTQPEGVAPILAHVSCDYLAPVEFPAEILAGARVTRIGKTSFHQEYVVALSEAPERPVANGIGVIVMFDYPSGNTVPIPDDLRVRISELDGVGE